MCDTQENNLPYNRVATVRKNVWKMKLFPGQGKIREFCGWSGKFRKALESQGFLKERICSLGEQILSFKSNTQI